MNVADLLSPDRVIAKLPAGDKPALLAELARRAAAATGLPQPAILEALRAREALGSTGVGSGVAIPHARIAGLDRFFGLFARLERRIDYDSVDEQPVDLVFLLLVPPEAASEHLQALACISRRLRDQAVSACLRRTTDAGTLYAALAEQEDQQPHAVLILKNGLYQTHCYYFKIASVKIKYFWCIYCRFYTHTSDRKRQVAASGAPTHLPMMTSEDLMMATTASPLFRPRSSMVSAVTVDVMVLPPPTSIFTLAEIGPVSTEMTVPFNWLRALSFMMNIPSVDAALFHTRIACGQKGQYSAHEMRGLHRFLPNDRTV